jgi:hypothetical protein
VLETARGGILLRGIGVLHNDVAVVTNVTEDHLGLHGIETVDQLAEVKATITRITRPNGWDVLNADDPRVLSMRRGSTGRAWLCSHDPSHPAIREVLAEGGRATVPLDGWMTVLEGSRSRPLVELVDVPVTIAGISRHNVMNAMQAASAALGDRAAGTRDGRGLEDLRHRSRTQPGPGEPVRARRAGAGDRLRAQRGRDDRAQPRSARACGAGRRSGSSSAARATERTRSCTTSRTGRRVAPTTSRSPSCCATCGAASASRSSNA